MSLRDTFIYVQYVQFRNHDRGPVRVHALQGPSRLWDLEKAEGRAKMVLIMKQMLLCEIQDLPTETRKENLRVFLEWLDVLYTASEYADWGDYKKNALKLRLQNEGRMVCFF